MRTMLSQPASPPARRAITAVLVLWLCVLAAGVWAPVARAQLAAQGVERLCSGEMAPQWAPSPATHAGHGDALGTALHHQIDVIDRPEALELLDQASRLEDRGFVRHPLVWLPCCLVPDARCRCPLCCTETVRTSTFDRGES